MEAVIKKWGNSLGLRLPKSITEQYKIVEGSSIEILNEKDYIKIKPVKNPKYSLEELVSRITKDNLHDEIDSDVSVGNEIYNDIYDKLNDIINKNKKISPAKKNKLRELLLKAPTISKDEYDDFLEMRKHFNRSFNADN